MKRNHLSCRNFATERNQPSSSFRASRPTRPNGLARCPAACFLLAALTIGIWPVKAWSGDISADLTEWRQERLAGLTSDEGWLSLVGLFWLEEGANSFGSGRSNQIVMPSTVGPAKWGTLHLEKGSVRIESDPPADVVHDGQNVGEMSLTSDRDGDPSLLKAGGLTFYIIERDNRFALRVKDPESEARTNFQGLEYYPADPSWRIEARFEPYSPPKMIPIPTVLGTIDQVPSPGAVLFHIGNDSYRLDAMSASEEKTLFLVFGDRTNGTTTYGGGRFLDTLPIGADNMVILDFNRAYNPPCAFTPYATCPLPPRQNRVPLEIVAGERNYGKHH